MVYSRPLNRLVINLVRSIRYVIQKGGRVSEPQYDAPPEYVEGTEGAPPIEGEGIETIEAPTPSTPINGEAATRRGRGRPRTRETIDRDQAVVEALRNGPKTREQLADELSQTPSLVYLALWRLSHQDPPQVVKTTDGGIRHAWQLPN